MIATAEKKIVVRKAPAEKASTYEEGFIVAGTDGAMYVVKGYDNGIKRWIKVKKENVEAPKTPTKRSYNKKSKPVMMEQETQTEEITQETPKKTAPKKERKAPSAPKKEKA